MVVISVLSACGKKKIVGATEFRDASNDAVEVDADDLMKQFLVLGEQALAKGLVTSDVIGPVVRELLAFDEGVEGAGAQLEAPSKLKDYEEEEKWKYEASSSARR